MPLYVNIMYEDINQILIKFNDKVVSANYFQSTLDSTTTSQLKDLYKVKKSSTDENLSRLISINKLITSHMITGAFFTVGTTKHSIDTKITELWLQNNRQNQWILAEVYESFEIFLTELYAYLGFANIGVWKISDLPTNEESTSLHSYTKQIQAKRITPRKIMNQLSSHIPELKQAEVTNSFKNINIRFAISVIENFRHLIVHQHGVIKDKEAFLQKVIKESGCSISKENNSFYMSFIDYYLGQGKYSNHIHLLKRIENTEFPMTLNYSRIGDMFNFLLSYSHYLVECLLRFEA